MTKKTSFMNSPELLGALNGIVEIMNRCSSDEDVFAVWYKVSGPENAEFARFKQLQGELKRENNVNLLCAPGGAYEMLTRTVRAVSEFRLVRENTTPLAEPVVLGIIDAISLGDDPFFPALFGITSNEFWTKAMAVALAIILGQYVSQICFEEYVGGLFERIDMPLGTLERELSREERHYFGHGVDLGNTSWHYQTLVSNFFRSTLPMDAIKAFRRVVSQCEMYGSARAEPAKRVLRAMKEHHRLMEEIWNSKEIQKWRFLIYESLLDLKFLGVSSRYRKLQAHEKAYHNLMMHKSFPRAWQNVAVALEDAKECIEYDKNPNELRQVLNGYASLMSGKILIQKIS